MTILITGAAGLNGTAAVREFARHSEPVRALVRNRAQARELAEIPVVELAPVAEDGPEVRTAGGLGRAACSAPRSRRSAS